MGLFTSKVPNTISDKDREDLNRRASKSGEPMFSRKAVEQRKASEEQRKQAHKS